jgi:hypothetical protein
MNDKERIPTNFMAEEKKDVNAVSLFAAGNLPFAVNVYTYNYVKNTSVVWNQT